jgi:hypothetical protein
VTGARGNDEALDLALLRGDHKPPPRDTCFKRSRYKVAFYRRHLAMGLFSEVHHSFINKRSRYILLKRTAFDTKQDIVLNGHDADNR